MTQCPTQTTALAIVDEEQEKFCAQARRIVTHPQSASDVLQDLRVAILSSKSLPQDAAGLRLYLSRMMTYVARKWRRKNRNSRLQHCDSPEKKLESIRASLEQMASGDADFGDVDLDFRRAYLRRRIRDLPPQCARVFAEVLSAGAATEAVATKLGMRLVTVKAHFQRAVKKLRGKKSPGGNHERYE